MAILAWWRKLLSQRPRPRPTPRLTCEELETRQLLAALSPPLHLDFGTATSPVAAGYTRVPLAKYAASTAFGWATTSGVDSRDRGTSDPLTRDFHHGHAGTFLVDLPNGDYDVRVTLGDALYLHDEIAVALQDATVATGLTTRAGEYLQKSFRATVANGQLKLTLTDMGGKDINFALDGLDIDPVAKPRPTLATLAFTPGWATFGEVLPAGKAFTALQVGDLPTQTDVKTRWPDGSIRFAVVSAYIPQSGAYPLREQAATSGALAVQLPAAAVQFTVGGVLYTAELPVTPSSDVWLNGPLAVEDRFVVTPVRADGTPLPFLRVIFDVRAYSGGADRLDVTVENTLDQAGATQATYSVAIVVNGQMLFQQNNVAQGYLTRWRQVFDLGLTESRESFDFTPFYQAGALPRFLSGVADDASSTSGSTFQILGRGGNTYDYMGSTGSRLELAPYPAWTAAYLVHQSADQLAYVLANGDLAGSWPVHLRNVDQSLISLDARPNFWWDSRAAAGNKPAGDLKATGPLTPDIAHEPSLAYVPYLLTGDRYYVDEMKFWANYSLLVTWPGSTTYPRGAAGILAANQVRGFAWALRNITDAAAYLPDNDPLKGYFQVRVTNNLSWLDAYAAAHNTPLGTLWEDKRPENQRQSSQVWIAPWEQNYLAWSIDHANQQGFSGGLLQRDRIARFQLSLFTTSGFDPLYAAPYVLAVGDRTSAGITYYTSLSQVFQQTFGPAPGTPSPFAGSFGVDARLMLMLGIKNGWTGALEAYNYLYPYLAVTHATNHLPDLFERAGWAIALDGEI